MTFRFENLPRSAHEIVGDAMPLFGIGGVYFLIQGDEIVYVGQSTNVHARVACHGAPSMWPGAKKDFDAWAYIACGRDSMDWLESIYIHALQPHYNGHIYGGEKHAPIKLAKLLEGYDDAAP